MLFVIIGVHQINMVISLLDIQRKTVGKTGLVNTVLHKINKYQVVKMKDIKNSTHMF